MPQAPRPANLPAGTIWRDIPHDNIPGSIWLPDTGYGALAPETEDYLRTDLAPRDRRRPHRSIVVYLPARLLDVVERREAHPDHRLHPGRWFPDGTDGWTEMLLPVAEVQPAPPVEN